MDAELFLEIANQVTKFKPFPYFDIAHCAITCLYVREDIGAGAVPFSRKHPLSTWFSAMLSIFGGAILANFLLGEPVLGAVKLDQQLLVATVVWYAIFYMPFDLAYRLVKFFPVKMLLSSMKEVYRSKKVYDGVVHASKLFPNSWFIMIVIGAVKGNGSSLVKILERLARGVWTPSVVELLAPTFASKASLVAALIFVVDNKTEIITAPHSLVFFGVAMFFVYFKVSSMVLGIHDPFVPFENLFCAVFLGGMADVIQRVWSGKSASAAPGTANTAGSNITANAEPSRSDAKSETAKKKD